MQTNEQPSVGRQLPPPTAGTRFDRFRGEVMAGGAVTERDPAEEPFGGGSSGAVAGLAILGLFVWLGFTSGWMLLFVVGILVSVFLHELGHFVTARLTGMKATQFFIGFGPRLWSFHRGETEYGVRLLPLGAFVRIIGMNNLDDVPPADEARTYRQKSYPRRMLVITAGSLMHLLIAIVLLFGVFAIRGQIVDRVGAEVGDVAADSGADVAGLRQGDIVVSVGGVPVEDGDLGAAVRQAEPGDTVAVVFERDGQQLTVDATLGENTTPGELNGTALLGVTSRGATEWEELSVGEAATTTFTDLLPATWESTKGIVQVLNPINIIDHLTGESEDLRTRPTTIVGVTGVSDDIGEIARTRRGALSPGHPQRVRGRVQHVPTAPARRRPCGDRHVRARPGDRQRRAALLRRRGQADAIHHGRHRRALLPVHVGPVPRHHKTPLMKVADSTERRLTQQIHVGAVPVGGGAPITVQSMTITKTADVEGTLQQIYALAAAGCDIVRCTCNEAEAAEGLAHIVPRSPVPVIADIHHQYRMALAALEAGVQGLRLNPGNIRKPEHIKAVASEARDRAVPIRIGVNAGSLDPALYERHGGATPEAMVESALQELALFREVDFDLVKISVKASSVPLMVEAYRQLADATDHPLHLGVTEAGPPPAGLDQGDRRNFHPVARGDRRHDPLLAHCRPGRGSSRRPPTARVAWPA